MLLCSVNVLPLGKFTRARITRVIPRPTMDLVRSDTVSTMRMKTKEIVWAIVKLRGSHFLCFWTKIFLSSKIFLFIVGHPLFYSSLFFHSFIFHSFYLIYLPHLSISSSIGTSTQYSMSMVPLYKGLKPIYDYIKNVENWVSAL